MHDTLTAACHICLRQSSFLGQYTANYAVCCAIGGIFHFTPLCGHLTGNRISFFVTSVMFLDFYQRFA
jgi:hypothetical protein